MNIVLNVMNECWYCHIYFASSNQPAAKMRILLHFLLFLLWITDAYLNPPWVIHQIDTERYVLEKKDSHNVFYLHNGTGSRHLGFGKVAVHLTLTSNPKRKNKSPAGKLDRRAIILLFLLLSGDVELNPGPLTQKQQLSSQTPENTNIHHADASTKDFQVTETTGVSTSSGSVHEGYANNNSCDLYTAPFQIIRISKK